MERARVMESWERVLLGLGLVCFLLLGGRVAYSGLWSAGKSGQLPAHPKAGASSAFWKRWGDGKAELSGYKGTTVRYGSKRKATAVLIYVTEPMDRKTWIKDDAVRGAARVPVLKLNHALKFRTGIYPYSVMTSVFAAVGRWRKEVFEPVKVTLSAQEWCGHVFYGIWPKERHVMSKIMSYFASEGESVKKIGIPKGTLVEDALWIQLRELDGAFAGGKDWRGALLPTLWATRKAHQPLRAVSASITRKALKTKGQSVVRYTLKYGNFWRVFEVEAGGARRVLGWSSSEGERMRLQKSRRLPYWGLNRPGDESYRKMLGID